MVLCAFCILGAIANLFAAGDARLRLQREQTDMLRRKKKYMEVKEKTDKGSVRVMQQNAPLRLSVSSDSRPRLDRNELMKCIEAAEKSRQSLLSLDPRCHHNTKQSDFNGKHREVEEMASEVQKLEMRELARNNNGVTGNDLSSVVMHASKAHIIAETCVDDHGKHSQLSVHTRENCKGCTDIDTIDTNVDGHRTDTFGFLNQVPVPNSAPGSNFATSTNLHAPRKEGMKQKGMETINLIEKESGSRAPGTSTSSRNMPKIIKSVKNAKEYLSGKLGISAQKLKCSEEVKVNLLAADVSACPVSRDKPDVMISKPLNGNTQIVDPSRTCRAKYADADCVSLMEGSIANAKHISGTNFHVAHARNPMFSSRAYDNEVSRQKKFDQPYDFHPATLDKPSKSSVGDCTSIMDNLIMGKVVYPSESLLGTVEDLNIEQRFIVNHGGGDNDAHSFPKSGNRQGLESQGTSDLDSSSIACSVKHGQKKLDAAVDNSKKLNDLLDNGLVDIKTEATMFKDAFGVSNVTGNRSKVDNGRKVAEGSKKDGTANLNSATNCSGKPGFSKVEVDGSASQVYSIKDDNSVGVKPLILDASQESGGKADMEGHPRSRETIRHSAPWPDHHPKRFENDGRGSWMEENFQRFDPIIKMIGTGFRENYMLAKENLDQSVVSAEVSDLGLWGEDEELEWMKDEKLREIVFQVRDNELAGRDPFHLMDAVDQHAFFKGLELKAEKLNGRLSGLHEWIHSRIENLDYGAGICFLETFLCPHVPLTENNPKHIECQEVSGSVILYEIFLIIYYFWLTFDHTLYFFSGQLDDETQCHRCKTMCSYLIIYL